MSRKNRNAKIKHAPKVTAPVTAAEVAGLGQQVGTGPTKKAKEPIIKTTQSELNEAFDFVGRMAELTGKIKGIAIGRNEPRNAGEARSKEQRGAVANILQEVFDETQKALAKHGPMHSPHEGHSVILEELDELWDEIKADRGRQASARMEAIQLAAMAVRYALDIDPR